jgi:RHS repeat-associated protein
VTKNGTAVSSYGYDGDDNRTSVGVSSPTNPTYDAQDRLLTYPSLGASYTYTANGELTNKTTSTGTTNYTYDVLGNLPHVGLPAALPDGTTTVDYIVDGQNRRVGRKVNGTLVNGWLYQDQLRPVAQVDGSGTNVVARFVYGSKANVPDYMTTSGGAYRILSDHLGSPRLVVDANSGNAIETLSYDEFGNETDTLAGTLPTGYVRIPFGFAGGLYDPDTQLVRFGARDYDASVGRWTRKDPITFGGGQFNMYVYVANDPVDHTDPSGRNWYSWVTFPYDLGLCLAYYSQYTNILQHCVDTIKSVCQCQPPTASTGLGPVSCEYPDVTCGETSDACLSLGVEPIQQCLQDVGGNSALADVVNACGPLGIPSPPLPVDLIERGRSIFQ